MLPHSVKPLDYFCYGFRGVQIPAPSIPTTGFALFDSGGAYVLSEPVGSAFGFPALGFINSHYYSTPFLNTGSASIDTDRLFVTPIWIPRNCTVDRIGTRSLAANAGMSARFGLYRDSGVGYPGTLVISGTSISVAGVGAKEEILAPAIALTKGLYWTACKATIGTATVSGQIGNLATALAGALTLDEFSNGDGSSLDVAGVVGALPDPFPAGADTSGINNSPRVGLRIAS